MTGIMTQFPKCSHKFPTTALLFLFFFWSVCVTEQLLLFYTTMKDGTLRQNNTSNSMRCIELNLLQSGPFIYLPSLHKLLPAYFLVPPTFPFQEDKANTV